MILRTDYVSLNRLKISLGNHSVQDRSHFITETNPLLQAAH